MWCLGNGKGTVTLEVDANGNVLSGRDLDKKFWDVSQLLSKGSILATILAFLLGFVGFLKLLPNFFWVKLWNLKTVFFLVETIGFLYMLLNVPDSWNTIESNKKHDYYKNMKICFRLFKPFAEFHYHKEIYILIWKNYT